MVHKLAIAAVIGLSASAVCMGAAAAIGGKEFGDGWKDMDFSWFDDKPRCEAVQGATATSRDLDWDDSDHVELAVQGHASYTPGNGQTVHVTGDPQVLAHLKVDHGDIEMDCRGWQERTKDLAITLPGREFRKFSIAGIGSLSLDRLDQRKLKIEMAGASAVKANGKVEELDIEMAGIGEADFGKVTGREAKVEIAGIGKADIAPSEEAKIEIAGPGEVTLHSNPKRLETEIAGPGRIHKAPGDS